MGLIKSVNIILWDYVLLIGLVGVGIFLSFKLKFPQVFRMFPALARTIAAITHKASVPAGRMTQIQSLSTAVAAQVGTGNIVGVSTAIASGGPGAAFWMLLSAFFGMGTIFAESVLAQVFRETRNGELVGGPAYYIKNGLQLKWLAKTFAILGILAMGIIGTMVQSNSIADSLQNAFTFSKNWTTIGLLAVVGAILTGGMGRIAKFTEKVVPVMAFFYIFGSLVIILFNAPHFLQAIKAIILGALNPHAIGGGGLGITVQQAVRYGLSRGLFSNEAGLGSTPHAHAVANTNHPAEQGFIAMIGVFVSTFLVCLSTVMVNLTSGAYDMSIPASQMTQSATTMTQLSFSLSFGRFGSGFLATALTFFALTTIIGWYFFAESNVKFLAGENKCAIRLFKLIVLGFIICGVNMNAQFVWQLTDLFTGIMALPNIVSLVLLSGKVKRVLDDYDACKERGSICWTYDYE